VQVGFPVLNFLEDVLLRIGMNVPLSKGDVLVANHHHTLWCYCLLFASGNMTERGCRCLHTGLPKFGAEYYVLLYACC
jgi:hypothetical protein